MRLLPSDPLGTRRARLVSFFLLYVSEGLPSGFAVVAVATQMRRLGLGPAEIGTYVAALYLPWAFKWAVGPIVDSLTVARWGPRRFWVVLAQGLMVVTLLVAMTVDPAQQLALFTGLLILHNAFAATQDVAIDALACNVLPVEERGTANGVMFAGQAVGTALGGGGVLMLTAAMPFRATFLVVAGAVALIGIVVSLRLRETAAVAAAHAGGPGAGPAAALAAAGARMREFLVASWHAFTGSRGALFGVLLALLPMGAMGLGLALQSNLAVELGMDDGAIGALAMASSFCGALGCVVGGWLSDRLGRRRTIALFVALMSVPGVCLALLLAGGAIGAAAISAFWTACLSYYIAQGLMYGAGTALYMDITTPRVAATQFTAYMALCNLASSMAAWWQGHSIERFGYPLTLGFDAAFGLVCLLILPFVTPLSARHAAAGFAPPSGPGPGAAIPEGVVH